GGREEGGSEEGRAAGVPATGREPSRRKTVRAARRTRAPQGSPRWEKGVACSSQGGRSFSSALASSRRPNRESPPPPRQVHRHFSRYPASSRFGFVQHASYRHARFAP